MPSGRFCSSRELELSSVRLCHAACNELGFQWDGAVLGLPGCPTCLGPPKCFVTFVQNEGVRKCSYNLDPTPNRNSLSTSLSAICKTGDQSSK